MIGNLILGLAIGNAAGAAVNASSATVKPLDGAFHQFRNVANNLCLHSITSSWGSAIAKRPCQSGSLLQLWASLTDSGSNIYRFENGATQSCLWAGDDLWEGQIIGSNECAVSGGTTVSNAQWDTGTALPNVVTLKSHVHFKTSNFCLDGGDAGDNVVIRTCNGGLSQKWVVGF
jgi:hypothetical protein